MRQSTRKQQAAVEYCEVWLQIDFTGDRQSFEDCHEFLKSFLKDAKDRERELYCEYRAYLWERYDA